MALTNFVEDGFGGRKYLKLINPANGEEIFNPVTGKRGDKIPTDNESDIRYKVYWASKTYEFWYSLAVKKRARFFQALKREVVKHSNEIAQLISEENGKNIAECWEEILVVLQLLEYYRRNGFVDTKEFRGTALNICKKIKTSVPPSNRGKNLGVVGIITPWNYPFMIPLNIAIRSLFYGNAVIIKPSEHAPLSGEMIQNLAIKAWERAGFQRQYKLCPVRVVQGGGGVGKILVSLINEGRLNFLIFCGSSDSGRMIKESVESAKWDRLELLLGGKDAFVVLENCDLKKTVNSLVAGCLFNTGQSCSSVERVYVMKSIADKVIAKVLDKAKTMKVGYDPNDYTIDLGPIMNKKQFDVLLDQLSDAVSRGAKILFGGKRLSGGIYDRGYYIEPTILVNVNHEMKIMREETFGPIIPIMVAETEEELVKLANDCRFGLTASVWTKEVGRGEKIAERLEAGTVYVNDLFWTASEPKVHWPGIKESGNSIDEQEFFRDKIIAITRGNLIDWLSSFWLSKNKLLKVRLLKFLAKFGFLF